MSATPQRPTRRRDFQRQNSESQFGARKEVASLKMIDVSSTAETTCEKFWVLPAAR